MAPGPEPQPAVDIADAPTSVAPRLGFTASRKIGGAVARNRAKRRLRAVARRVMCNRALPGFDYVLVARSAVLTCTFVDLEKDLESALAELLRRRRDGGSRASGGSGSGSSTEP